MKPWCLAVLILWHAATGLAQASTDSDKKELNPERGYWYYEDPVKKKEEKRKQTQIKKRQPLGPLPPYKELLEAHPADLRKIFKERLEEVVWKPTPQNMYAFMLVKDVTRRKALAVAQMHSFMLLKNPNLNMNTVRAVSTFARDTEAKARQQELNRVLAQARTRYALLYFRSETCIYCREQDSALKFFQVNTGWKVKVIDVDKQPRVANRMNVTMTPTILLIKRNSDDYMPVGVGATAADQLSGNIYRAVRLLEGDVTPEQFFMYEYDKGGLMDPVGDPTEPVIHYQGVSYEN